MSWFEQMNQAPIPDKQIWWQCQTTFPNIPKKSVYKELIITF
ncbi:hypothetical protein GXM_06054 [Nostoc sphaeroides CCNUC1]|uniref:Uncharacterized protein n=1 Tax=Nostoc sphaeroides CCNUC1 TaxID=2653204 RepID=A0A5P8W7D5_9NOSO|nr:hypothetical protein GXM_06054 [Nostoc sphaeroides CCNUC1]